MIFFFVWKVGIDIFFVFTVALLLMISTIVPRTSASNRQSVNAPQMPLQPKPRPALSPPAPPQPISSSRLLVTSSTSRANVRRRGSAVSISPNNKKRTLMRIHVAERREEDESGRPGRQRRRRMRRRGRQGEGGSGANRVMPPGVRPVKNKGGRLVYEYGGHPFDEYRGKKMSKHRLFFKLFLKNIYVSLWNKIKTNHP